MTETRIRSVIQSEAEAFPSIAAAAKSWGFTRAYLHDVLKGRRGVSDALARKVGYCKEELTEIRFTKLNGA